MTKDQHIYIQWYSRAHRVIENTFGILTARQRLFLTFIKISIENTEIVLGCLALHNYLRQGHDHKYQPLFKSFLNIWTCLKYKVIIPNWLLPWAQGENHG